MSGVYIKGQTLPEEGKCYFLQIFHDGTIYDSVGRRVAATAIPVPDHGRLIDANAIGDFLRNKYWNSPWVRSHILDKIVRDVKGFQAIIPADERLYDSLKRGLEQAVNGEYRSETIPADKEGEE